MKTRRIEGEILEQSPEQAAGANLADLARINRWMGGHRIVRGLLGGLRPPPRFTMLDVGAASGDFARLVRRVYPESRVVSVDLHARHMAHAPMPKLVADAFRLPFAAGAFDYVFCSLLLHHFPDDGVVRLLESFGRIARRAVIAVDLERTWLAEWFLPATGPVLRWHPVTLHDGPVSVRASFRRPDLVRLAARAGLADPRIRRHRPWSRLSLVAAALS
ncbi:MAG: methyltransferase domain-containing protein [Bryobacteraceae bacterium]